jgi:hypothetical protein
LGLDGCEGLFVVAHEHAFTGFEVDGGAQFRFVHDAHLAAPCLVDDVRVVGRVGQDGVVVVGEEGEMVLPCLLLEVRHQFRIDAFFVYYLFVCHVNELAPVVGEHETSMVLKFQLACQGQHTVGWAAGGEYDANACLLHAAQSVERARGYFPCCVEECSVNVDDQ